MGITAFPFSSVIDVPTARILGRDDAGTGSAEALTNTEIFAILGTGTPSASTYLRGDGTWATVSAGISSLNGLTDATQTFAVGTTGTDVAFVSAAGVHTLNIPDASATARGVVTTGTQRFAGIKYFNAADIRLGSGSNDQRISTFSNDLYIDNNVGPNIYFRCSSTSLNYLTVSSTSPNVRFLAGFSIATNTVLDAGGNDVLESRRSTNAQTYRVYNTYTSATSFERLNLSWASNVCYIGTEKGSAGGTARDLTFGTDGAVRLVLPAAATSGALYLGPRADNTTTGGNARGSGAVDLQTSRSAATQVASGSSSVILGGQRNSATGARSAIAGGFESVASGTYEAFAFGERSTASGFEGSWATGTSCTSSASYAHARGNGALANRQGMQAEASGGFGAAGDAQHVRFFVRNKTTTNSAVTLFLDGSSLRLTIPAGKILHATVQILGSKSDGTAVASYMRQVTIKNVGGTTSLVGTVNTIGTDEAAGTSIAITADDTNDALQINVTGILNETWRWVAVVYGVEIAYGT